MFKSLHLDLIVHILPDKPKEATGQGDHEGVLEEVREDEEAGAVEQDTSQPEAIGALCEERVVVIDGEAGWEGSEGNSLALEKLTYRILASYQA